MFNQAKEGGQKLTRGGKCPSPYCSLDSLQDQWLVIADIHNIRGPYFRSRLINDVLSLVCYYHNVQEIIASVLLKRIRKPLYCVYTTIYNFTLYHTLYCINERLYIQLSWFYNTFIKDYGETTYDNSTVMTQVSMLV